MTPAQPALQNVTEYDDVPYESFPYTHTHPQHLRTIARLFGLQPKPVAQARILELGGAAGGNVMPVALLNPQAQVITLDLSAKQIAEGELFRQQLGLTNIALRHASIMDVDAGWGTFDYIICHGVFSWVPEVVQKKILRICSDNLAEDGVAFVSYNTLPGWNMVKTMRDMMIYHTQRFADPAQKAQQARQLLQFVHRNVQQKDSPYAEFLETEIKILNTQADAYLIHEHLESHNTAFYFHQFMTLANENNLAYLGDCNLQTMFTGNMSDEVAKLLSSLNDIVRTEQYMDFITNRRFRNTMLTHKKNRLNRKLDAAQVRDFFISSMLTTPDTSHDVSMDREVVFQGGMTFTSRNRIMNAAMFVLLEQAPKPISFDAWVDLTVSKLGDVNENSVSGMILQNALRLALASGITLHDTIAPFSTKVSAQPRLWSYARAQLATKNWTTSMDHRRIGLDALGRVIALALDGTRTTADLTAHVLEKVRSGELNINQNGQAVTDAAQQQEIVSAAVTQQLKTLCNLALLEA